MTANEIHVRRSWDIVATDGTVGFGLTPNDAIGTGHSLLRLRVPAHTRPLASAYPADQLRDRHIGLRHDYYPATTTAELLHMVLGRYAPADASNADCREVSDLVTENLHQRGLRAARTLGLTAWTDPATAPYPVPQDAKLIAFIHSVTVLDGWVADGTARQFMSQLPRMWVAPLPDYLAALTAATGVAAVVPHRSPNDVFTAPTTPQPDRMNRTQSQPALT
ncbi:hypothetical protein [Nocardia yamanashiensis]|uniref:hypothetical protein n=1 Tax=Nocardia yamanashiensis TaxID=209247 RepID=UPI0012FE606F|nr:hypothetical protein [Nocardia yamanashiensis]